ncbi:LOW QUALITY PROTEIN: ML-like domain-containing protein [Bipolaris maydis]|nr:LOW QUALITY PROTEIN: ML-like domain-containing protein [Bipolaris maydis]
MRIQQHITFLLAIYLSLILSITFTIANQTEYVRATIKGIRTLVRDDRQPSLYTTDYADCLGNSAINITRFDAAYYKDNMTITFHLRGETALQNHIMLNIAVFAYGETRFSLTFNPCDANIWSACPVRPGTPIEAAEDVAGIPELALSIPDFEGQAVMRVFANETESEIGWFAAGITNGWTFGQQDCVGAVLGGFTLVAVAALFATAVCGADLTISVWHYVFYSGAIEVDWPSVLLAFWSNYAWRMIDGFGDEIFRRSTLPIESGLPNALENRGLHYGKQVKPGLPLPGDYSGFAVRNAFATGLLWLLFLSVCAIISILALKAVIEILATLHIYFRCHYLAYIAAALLRIIFMSFFLITSLGTVAVACLVFVTVVLGLGSIAAYACFSREYVFEPDRINISKHRIFKVIPWNSGGPPLRDSVCVGSIPWWRIHAMADFPSIHSDEEYTVKFGWLVSRYRKSRWWFFVVWLSYEFFRASFLAGASNQPTTIALVAFILLRPFEGQRLNVIAVYLLGFTFDPRFCIARIPATVIGIVIISLLTIAVMLLILIGAVSNHTEMKPKSWTATREKYFDHIAIAEQDIPRSRKRPDSEDIITAPYFEVKQIEDEDIEFMDEISQVPHPSPPVLSPNRTLVSNSPGSLLERSRTGSFQSQASYSSLLPRAARLHRANWSTHDLNDATRTRRHRAVSDTSLISRLRHVEKLERKPSLGGASMKRSDTPALLSYGYADGGSNGACGACGAG